MTMMVEDIDEDFKDRMMMAVTMTMKTVKIVMTMMIMITMMEGMTMITMKLITMNFQSECKSWLQ